MANCMFYYGQQGFAAGDLDWDLHQFKAYLVDLNDCGAAAGGWIVSTHDNAATVTVTTTAAHGIVAGDRVTFKGVVDTIPTVAISTAYTAGALVKTGTSALRCIKAGTSAGAGPTYNVTAVGDVTQDGTVAWRYEGTAASVGSILNAGSWDANRLSTTGYWVVNTAPTGTTFTIVLPNAPGVWSSGGVLANLQAQFVSGFVPVGGRVALSPALSSKTNVGGVVSAANPVFTAATGDVSEAVIIAKTANTGGADDADTAQRCVAFYDSLTNLPVTPNGGDITFNISPNLFTL